MRDCVVIGHELASFGILEEVFLEYDMFVRLVFEHNDENPVKRLLGQGDTQEAKDGKQHSVSHFYTRVLFL
jgi:hypothetical protein